MNPNSIARVAVPVPRRQTFDFRIPQAMTLRRGMRVRVPFGQRRLVGVVTAVVSTSSVPESRLRYVLEALDAEPVFPRQLFKTLLWTADYYHHSLGDVFDTALPVTLRGGAALQPRQPRLYEITSRGLAQDCESFRRAPVQWEILQALQQSPHHRLEAQSLSRLSGGWKRAADALVAKGLARVVDKPEGITDVAKQPRRQLNSAQRRSIDRILASAAEYQAFLLDGVTGSGKTEVYLGVIEQVIRTGRQALVLVPEIGLTPQLIQRFRERLHQPMVVVHSGLSPGERHRAWWAARQGTASVVLGTRSAVFTPFKRAGIFIVDEEHDTSYKQQEGLRYHARDLALYRAKLEQIPVVLGSATPSLETLSNVAAKRYKCLELPVRAGSASLPVVRLLDLRRLATDHGLTRPLVDAIQQRIDRSEQSLIFLNRRGFAPALFCGRCSWFSCCPRCDAKLTYHKQTGHMRCHHCGRERPVPAACPDCGHTPLIHLGAGTQRVEEALVTLFPAARVLRIDRDATRQKGRLAAQLARVREGHADILVGTQLLTKGHDFPDVTLVGVINADHGLYSADFRAAEYLFQQIIQVAGRAGRSDKQGEVLIQTWHPEHAYFESLRAHDYAGFAHVALAEREQARYPPYQYFALLRAESLNSRGALEFLSFARGQAEHWVTSANGVQLMDPVPAPMEKRAGRYRAQLLVSAGQRSSLHRLLGPWIGRLEQSAQAKKVRWSIDIDPIDMY